MLLKVPNYTTKQTTTITNVLKKRNSCLTQIGLISLDNGESGATDSSKLCHSIIHLSLIGVRSFLGTVFG